jgi:hypothetical protein
LPNLARFLSLAPRSLATIIDWSNCATGPKIWRISTAVGVSSVKQSGLSAAISVMPSAEEPQP